MDLEPTTPSATNPAFVWKALTTIKVLGPNFPSATKPRRVCRQETSAPIEPSLKVLVMSQAEEEVAEESLAVLVDVVAVDVPLQADPVVEL